MNLFNIFNRKSKIENRKSTDEVPISRLSPEMLAWMTGSSTSTPSVTLRNAYEQVVWVYRAINVLAEQVANVPFLFSAGERGRENLITSGPLLHLYNQPHPQINRFQYWELRVMWLMLRGECMRIPLYEAADPNSKHPQGSKENPFFHTCTASARSRNARLKHVLILDPSRFQHIIQRNHLEGWRYTGLSQNTPLDSQVFLPEEVWFEKLPNPFDFWRGLPPLYVADLAAKSDFSAANFMRGIMENNADNGLIVRTNEQLDEEQRAQIYAALKNRKRSAGCADGPLLLSNSAEVIQPRLSSADLQFLENRKFSRGEICAAFGVPEEIVASTDHNKYDVMQGARLNFIENRVAPLCARLEADENVTTIPAITAIENQNSKFKNVIGWFDLDSLPIMQQARRDRLLAAKTGFDMGIPFNELNRVLDLGFKPQPWGDNGFLPAKYHLLKPEPTSVSTPEPAANGKSTQPSAPATNSDSQPPASSSPADPGLCANQKSEIKIQKSPPVTLYAPPPPPPPAPQPSADPTLAAIRELHDIMCK